MDGRRELPPARIIEPVEFRSPVSETRRRLPLLRWFGMAALLGVVLLLGAGVWVALAWERVEIEVEPAPDRVTLDGPGGRLEIGGVRLLRPGDYRVSAALEGYRTLEETIEVRAGQANRFELELLPLPGLVTVVATSGADGDELSDARVIIDGAPIGRTPLGDAEVEPGRRKVRVEHARHRAAEIEIDVEGFHRAQRVELALEPDWSEVAVASTPAGAEVRLDGAPVGATPCVFEAMSGARTIEVAAAGYEPVRFEVEVVAGRPVSLEDVVLHRVPGRVRVETDPPGALITVGEEFMGTAPLDVRVEPGQPVEVRAAMEGHAPASQTLSVESGDERTVRLALAPEYGIVRLAAEPADTMLRVDGGPAMSVASEIELLAVEHTLEFTREGFEPQTRTVRPRPGIPLRLEVTLQRIPPPQTIATPDGYVLTRITGGAFRMGASRGEQGMRSNETLREIKLERPFYIGVREVTNAEFDRFDPAHDSGEAGGAGLDGGDRPVVGVTWDEAARYCNWLSAREGLPAAYVEREGAMRAVAPPTTGYRLPTEAEWAYVARVDGKGATRMYPWGDRYPPTGRAGNYADKSAGAGVAARLEGYDDGFATTAPVGSFEPNHLGVHDMGGNVAEWCHDYYDTYTYNPSTVWTDPVGPERGRHHVVRGSSWRHFSMSTLRCAYRDYADEARDDLGFRLCRYLDDKEDPP